MERKVDWRELFPADYDNIEIYEQAFKVKCNVTEEYVLLRERAKDSDKLFLACVYRKDKGEVAVLYTFNERMRKPTCSLCTSPGCPCFRWIKDIQLK